MNEFTEPVLTGKEAWRRTEFETGTGESKGTQDMGRDLWRATEWSTTDFGSKLDLLVVDSVEGI